MTYRLHERRSTNTIRIKRITFGLVAAVFVLFTSSMPFAFAVDADSSAPTSSTCTPVNPSGTGIVSPTGSDAVTYTYDSCTGLWVNPYYTWSPATQTATPITPYVYTCDTTNWDWTYQQWEYSPASKSWFQATQTVSQLPNGAIIAGDSLTVCAPPPPPTQTVTPDSSSSSASPNTNPSTITGDSSNSATLDSTTNATVNNLIGSQAQSGDAAVVGNTNAGDATSGNAVALSNDVNSLQSSTTLTGPVTTFVANINGNVQGNLIVDPSQLQPANETLDSSNDLTVNTANNGQINNTINLNADSGNATVDDNTNAGNATSGSAEAIANVVNMIDSVISSGQSFIGVININGNLTGDILMPQSFLNSLIASNAPSTTVDISNSVANSLGINTTNNEAINNNTTSTATSGNATENGNTNGGSATSGNTSTAVTIFNLTGNEIIGTNALLVFVNVPGSWVGVIMNAPTGATAAALGGDLTENTTNTANIDTTNNDSINNNVNASAASGNATVNDNNNAGNATSGNAATAINFLNLDNTQFDLTGWFGILFINVFGTWVGNFGVYTPPATPTSTTTTNTQTPNTKGKVFNFVPTTNSNVTAGTSTGTNLNAQLVSKKSVLGSSTSVAAHTPAVATVMPVSHTSQIVGGILLAVGVGTLIIQNLVSRRGANKSTSVRK